VLITGIGGVVCFVLLVIVETRIAAPLLDLSLYKVRLFTTSNLVAFGFSAPSSAWSSCCRCFCRSCAASRRLNLA